MILTTKNLFKFSFFLLLFMFISCKEEDEIIIPLPEHSTIDDLQIIKSHSLADLQVVSIYQGAVDVDLRLPLDSLISNDSSSHKYKILLSDIKLKSSDTVVETEKYINSNNVIVELEELNPNTYYRLEFNFKLVNEDDQSVVFSEYINFHSYQLPKHYNELSLHAVLRDEDVLMPYDLVMFKPSLPQNKVVSENGSEFKSVLKLELQKDGDSVNFKHVYSEEHLIFYNEGYYLFEPGIYSYNAEEVFYEKIYNEWVQTKVLEKEGEFEVLSSQETYLLEQSHLDGERIDKNETFNLAIKEIESIGSNFLDAKVVLDSAVLESQSGSLYNLNIFNEDQFYRIIPSILLNENENVNLKYFLKYDLSNDSIDYKFPEVIETVSNDFKVSDTIGSLLKRSDLSASYPIPLQRNFLIEEFDRGAFQFSTILGIEGSFDESRNYEVLFIKDNDTLKSAADWNDNDLSFKFDLPTGLETYSIYNYQIVDNSVGGLLFSDYFKTSKFRTFTEKMDNLRASSGSEDYSSDGPLPGGRRIFIQIFPDEIFDFVEFDMEMGENNGLISVTGILSDTDWYTNNFYQELYSNLDKLPFQIDWRGEYKFNKIPNNAFYCASNDIDLSIEEIETGNPRSFDESTKFEQIICNYSRVFKGDFIQLDSLAQDYSGEQNDYVDLILESEFKGLSRGLYPTEIKYIIPVYNEVTYSTTWSFWKQY
ncbi:MAG: hypothetical protein ACQETL_09260 [Bacteroidota bacterium]